MSCQVWPCFFRKQSFEPPEDSLAPLSSRSGVWWVGKKLDFTAVDRRPSQSNITQRVLLLPKVRWQKHYHSTSGSVQNYFFGASLLLSRRISHIIGLWNLWSSNISNSCISVEIASIRHTAFKIGSGIHNWLSFKWHNKNYGEPVEPQTWYLDCWKFDLGIPFCRFQALVFWWDPQSAEISVSVLDDDFPPLFWRRSCEDLMMNSKPW